MRVLLVNDDGPPSPHSPHILGLYEELCKQQPEWEISVVLPSSQKSWGSMAFTLNPPCSAWYYYPRRGNYDGTHGQTNGSWSAKRRQVQEDEVGEWILVDGSPTTCANIGLFSLDSLQPSQSSQKASSDKRKPAFDLVVSGPNYGRNTGTAFSLCSGTIGAALAASLSGVRAISLSYAHFMQSNEMVRKAEEERKRTSKTSTPRTWGQLPPSAPQEVVRQAHVLSSRLIKRLNDEWESDVGVYTVNVPLTWHLVNEIDAGSKVFWTRTWDSQFGPLFALEEESKSSNEEEVHQQHKPSTAPKPTMALRFAPNMATMLQPNGQGSHDTDIWAIMQGHISVSRLQPSYTAVTSTNMNKLDPNKSLGTHFKL